MKARFSKSALQEALGLVGSIIAARTPKPILQCVKITCSGETASFSATDLEVGITCAVPQVEIEEEGEIVVPSDKVSSIVRESTDEVLEFSTDDLTVHIRGVDSRYTIYGHNPEQFPIVPGYEGEADFEVSLDSLQDGIELTIFSAAKESTRYAINGILWEVKGKKLTLVATDGRRLARAAVGLESSVSDKTASKRIIVPVKAMGLLDRIGPEDGTTVAVRYIDNKIVLGCGQAVVSSNLVDGNFPKYEDIIPTDYTNKVVLPTEPTLSAVRRAALLANEDSKGIKVALSEGKVVFSSRAPETGDAEIDMAVDYDGGDLEIGFNPQFLIDVLRVIKTSDFDLELGESDRPGMIRVDRDFVYVVMPVNI